MRKNKNICIYSASSKIEKINSKVKHIRYFYCYVSNKDLKVRVCNWTRTHNRLVA